jgi:hypothetical protein
MTRAKAHRNKTARTRTEDAALSGVWELPIEVSVLDRQELEERAVSYYAAWYRPGRMVQASSFTRQALDAIVLEYVELHLLTWRQNTSVELSRKQAKEWYRAMSAKICEAVSAAYPHLATFCRGRALAEFGVVKRLAVN